MTENNSEHAENAENAGRESGENIEQKAEISPSTLRPFLLIMVVVLAGFVILNQYLINSMVFVSAAGTATQNAAPTISNAELLAIEAQILPKGVPAVYGSELGIRYDDVDINDQKKANALIDKLAALDDPNPKNSMTADQLKRFVAIGNMIGCEYCCGLGVMVRADGSRPCSCLHSYAMRGVAQYLIKNHPEMTDDQILEEVGKWKTLFFPDNIGQKALVLKEKGIELNYINLASNKYKDIESGSAGGARQVGGC